jgi:hypothetical protein
MAAPTHARLVRARVPADRLDEYAQRIAEAAPTIGALAGFEHGYVLVDRQRGEALALTLWASAEQRDAAAPTARDVLARAIAATGGQLGDLLSCEIVAEIQAAG